MYCHIHHCHYHHCNCVPTDSKEKGGALTQEELLALTEEMKQELKDYTVDLKDQIFSYIDIGLNPVEIANSINSLKEQDTYILRTLTNKIDDLNNSSNLSMFNLRTRVTDLEGQSAATIKDLYERTLVVESVSDLSTIKNPKNGLRVYVKSYYAGKNRGGGYFTYNSSKAGENDGGLVINGWVRDDLDLVSVKHFGAVGDAITDDTAAFKANASFIEKNKIPYMFVPTTNETYKISEPIRFKEPGILIKGMKGATYDRGFRKLGCLLLTPTCSHGLDLGDNRKSSDVGYKHNPADAFSVRNIGIQSEGRNRKGNGIVFSCATDGPDRGGAVSEVSLSFLDKGIYLPEVNTPVSYAILIIQDSVLSNNNYGIYADGSTYGARIVGNQIEHNVIGGIWGRFNGSTLIADNLLEGQPRAITLLPRPSAMGIQPFVEITRNYFEAQTIYVVSAEVDNPKNRFYLHDNYMNRYEQSLQNDPNFDYFRIQSKASVATVVNHDAYPVTLLGASSLSSSSDILSNVRYYYTREVTGGAIYYCQELERIPVAKEDVDVVSIMQPLNRSNYINSPIGDVTPWVLTTNTSAIKVSTKLVKDKTYTMFMLYKTESGDTTENILQLWDDEYKAKIVDRSYNYMTTYSKGSWTLMCITFKASASNQSFGNLRFYTSTGEMKPITVAGIVIKDHGVISLTERNKVEPVLPINKGYLEKRFEITAASPVEVPANSTISITYTVPSSIGLTTSMSLRVRQLYLTNSNVLVLATVAFPTSVRVFYTNPTSEPITMLSGHKLSLVAMPE